MPTRYKISGIVTISAPLFGSDDFVMDSPEFEITQGRQADYTAFIGVTYYVMQGSVERKYFVEYPKPFAELNDAEMTAVTNLITNAHMNVLSIPDHVGATPV